jgi:hypothetical protein
MGLLLALWEGRWMTGTDTTVVFKDVSNATNEKEFPGCRIASRLRRWFLGCLQFMRPLYEFLEQSTHHRCVRPAAHRPRRSGKCAGSLRPQMSGDRPLEAAVAILGPGHFILLDEVLPLLLIFVQTDAQHHERLVTKLLCDFPHMRQSLTAGCAPGCLEVHQDDLALQVIERDAMAIKAGDGKRPRHSGAG